MKRTLSILLVVIGFSVGLSAYHRKGPGHLNITKEAKAVKMDLHGYES